MISGGGFGRVLISAGGLRGPRGTLLGLPTSGWRLLSFATPTSTGLGIFAVCLAATGNTGAVADRGNLGIKPLSFDASEDDGGVSV